MKRKHSSRIGLTLLIVAGFCLAAPRSSSQNLSQHCHWGFGPPGTSGAITPVGDSLSANVITTPVVMNLGGTSLPEIAFISFRTDKDSLFDRGGTLRIINGNCNQLASFPNYVPCPSWPVPLNCPSNLYTTPHLASGSGLAVGNVDANPDVEIIGVVDSPHPQKDHKQIIAFNVVGSCVRPKWCSIPLASNDIIPAASYPAIAQLDQPGFLGDFPEIIIDNKVYAGTGVLRYSGYSFGGNNCAVGSGTLGGLPCPQSRTTVVANLLGITLPQLMPGRGLYRSNPGPTWIGTLLWDLQIGFQPARMSKSPNLYPAVADLDLDVNHTPEVVVSDWNKSKLRVLSPAGTMLAWVDLPGVPPSSSCGGPPVIGNVDGTEGPEIGVASCRQYTVYRFTMGGVGTPAGSPGTLTQVWSEAIVDNSGGMTSTIGYTPDPVIYYADEHQLYVFSGPIRAGTQILQSFPNTSASQNEGPIVAALDSTMRGRVIVVANDFNPPIGLGFRGVRVFQDPKLRVVRNFWNQHSYHMTNVTNSSGVIPITEQSSWLTNSAARNSYRVQLP